MESVLKRIAKSACFYFGNHVIAHVPFYWIRHCYYRNILRMRIGRGSAVHMGAFFVWNHITIGENSIINRQCYLDGRVGVEIGNNVSISPQVMVLSLTHDKNSPYFATIPGKVTIEDYTWIGSRAIILQGVTLGRGCVVAAGAVVTKDVAPFCVIGGIPAKPIGTRNPNLEYTLNYQPWFDSDIS